jgi:hypothetical protein
MSQEIDLCRDSYDDNGEQPYSTSVPSLPPSRKRRRDKEASCDDAHPRNNEGPGNKNATGSAEFVVDLELAYEVEAVSPHKKRRGVMKSKPSGKNDAAGQCLQILKGVDATEKDVGSVADHRESQEGIALAAAASHPMNSDSEQTSRKDGSANKHSKELSTSKPPSNASWQQRRVSAWDGRLSELADYRKLHGHCNAPQNDSENPKLGKWVSKQRTEYKLHLEGKRSSITPSRIKELESLSFEWDSYGAAWEDRLSELVDYRKIHGHCNVPENYSENTTLANWVKKQRCQYRLHLEGMTSNMTTYRIQELESLGFECDSRSATWEERLSELADYCRIYGHCNVPSSHSENTKLGHWVRTQRKQYKLHLKGKSSHMTTFRIQALGSFGFEWEICHTAWEDRLKELADYCKIHGHCNVPQRCSQNVKLGKWVGGQRNQYRLHLEGRRSSMTLPRVEALEGLGFEWNPSLSRRKEIPKKPSLADDARRVHKKPANSRQETAPFNEIMRATGYH